MPSLHLLTPQFVDCVVHRPSNGRERRPNVLQTESRIGFVADAKAVIQQFVLAVRHDHDANPFVFCQMQQLAGTEDSIFVNGVELLNHVFAPDCGSNHQTRITQASVFACLCANGTRVQIEIGPSYRNLFWLRHPGRLKAANRGHPAVGEVTYSGS